MESPPPVPLCASKNHYVDAQPPANRARTVLPRPGSQGLPIPLGVVLLPMPHGLVILQSLDDLSQTELPLVIREHSLEARTLEFSSGRKIHHPRQNQLLQLRIFSNLGDPHRRVV